MRILSWRPPPIEAGMNTLRRPPGLLAVVAVVLVGQTLLSFAFGPSITRAAAIAVAVFVALLLLWGSRFAWVVALIGAGGQLVSSAISTDSNWGLAAGGIVVICLLAPPSVRFVWSKRPHRQAGRLQRAVKRPYERVKASAYAILARVAEWENGEFLTAATRKQRSYRLLIWRLGVSCVLLLVLVGATYNWQQGSGRGNSIVNVIASVTWTCYALVQLAFIAVSMIAVYRHLTSSRVPPESSKSARSKPSK